MQVEFVFSEGCQEFFDFYFHVLDHVCLHNNMFMVEMTKKQ